MENYKVRKIAGAPSFDSLPVAKITRYPLEKRDYKPYAQAILCVGEDALTLRMWAFEVSPPSTSRLRGVFYLFADREKALWVDIFAQGVVELTVAEEGQQQTVVLPPAAYSCREWNGEDLQGVYWGSTVTIPLSSLEELGGPLTVNGGDVFPGNFYKLCDKAPYIHQGSCFAADFTGQPYSRENMGRFEVVLY